MIIDKLSDGDSFIKTIDGQLHFLYYHSLKTLDGCSLGLYEFPIRQTVLIQLPTDLAITITIDSLIFFF